MRHDKKWLGLVALAVALDPLSASSQSAADGGVELAELSWTEAEEVLTPDAVVLLPLGAAAKEHGPHLRLDNDYQMAEYLKRRMLAVADVVVAPIVTYHFYPAFLEYPGSTHRPLTESAEVLREDGILLHYTNILEVAGSAAERIREQVRGTHADIAELRDTALPAAAARAGPSDAADESAESQVMPERIDLPAELDRVLRDYEVAWRDRDADALANLFSEDGFVLRPGRPPVRGRNAIRVAYADSGGPLWLFAYGYAVEGSVGYVIGGFATRPGGDAVGKFVLALRRDASGVWKIAADMDNGN